MKDDRLWDIAFFLSLLEALLHYSQWTLSLFFLTDGLYLFGHLESIFLVLESGWRLVFAFVLTIFSTILLHISRSRLQLSN